MKKYIAWISILVLFTTHLNSQSILPKKLISYPVLIELKNAGTGTGFFVLNKNKCFLITAYHVLYNQKRIRSKSIILVSYPHDPHINKTNVLEVNLDSVKTTDYIKYNRSSDVSAIYIADADTAFIRYHNFVSKRSPMSSLNLIQQSNSKDYGEILIGNDIYIFGYPTSIGLKQIPQIDYQRPLIRKGIIAGKNINSNTIIIDCPTQPGNSGGPVFEMDIEFSNISFQASYWIIGFVSEFVPFAEEWSNKRFGYSNIEISNSGYTIVIPIKRVFELLEEFK